MADRYTLKQLEALSQEELQAFINDVSGDEAFDSEAGGDSDADDELPALHPSTSISGTNKVLVKAAGSTSNSDLDSDDSVNDPDFVPEPPEKRMRRLVSSEPSSDSDEPDEPCEVMQSPSSAHFHFVKKASDAEIFSGHNFTQPFGPKCEVNLKSPLQIFLTFFTFSVLEMIVDQSNLYAQQKGVDLGLSVDELKAFFGILLIMGFHSLPTMRLYWSSDPNFHVSRISSVMSLRRYLKILRFLHLGDNEKMPERGTPTFDKLYKIRPLITHMNTVFLNCFNPGRYISVDESMVGFKGRSSLKQYMPLKPTKRGFKVWVAACATTGFMLSFSIYEGKNLLHTEGSLGENVVMTLAAPFQMLGYCIFFDRFFTSFPLLFKLLSKNIFACGTINQNRKYFPKHSLQIDRKLKLGESDYAMDNDISVVKWKDRGTKSVMLASNMHNPSVQTQVSRTNKKGVKEMISCPQVVADYNAYMGGVDRFDQLLSSYSISWKSRRWWVKLFYYVLDSAVVNSFILYSETMKLSSTKGTKPMSHLNFRNMLANELIDNYCSKKTRGPKASPKVVISKAKFSRKSTSCTGNVKSYVMQLGDVGSHMPAESTPRRCAHCSTKKNPKRSRVVCKKCNVALCINCFEPFHKSS